MNSTNDIVEPTQSFYQLCANLYGRWQDEKEYEDFNDYVKVATEAATKQGLTLVKMTKRPFTVEVKNTKRFVIKVTARKVTMEFFAK
jgi:hypothetical protein